MFRLPCVVWVSAPCAGWMDRTFRVIVFPISHVSTVSRVITSWVLEVISTFKNPRFPNHRKPTWITLDLRFLVSWPPGLEVIQQKSGAKTAFSDSPRHEASLTSQVLRSPESWVQQHLWGPREVLEDGLPGGENCCAWEMLNSQNDGFWGNSL